VPTPDLRPQRRPTGALARGLLWARVASVGDALVALGRHGARMVVQTLRYGDWRALEMWTATLATCWGLWFVASQWSVMDLNAAYVVMIHVASWLGLTGDGFWGGLLLLGGVVQWIGFYTESPPVERAAALHLTVVWTFMAWCFIVAEPRLVATITLPLYIAPSIWVYIRVTRAAAARAARLDADPSRPPGGDGDTYQRRSSDRAPDAPR
jgi:hypothetical protein